MNLLPKIKILLHYCQLSMSVCQAAIQKLNREIAEMQRQESELQSHIDGLQQLLEEQQPAHVVLRREQIFSWLRKQAVLRRQIQQLHVELSSFIQQREKFEAQRASELQRQQLWRKKEDKYLRRATAQRRQMFITELRFEENETEDLINGYRKTPDFSS